MRVLVACEFSGIVRDAFARCGHDAWSCDLLPTERPGNHIQGDVTPLLLQEWDMIIAFPPCTHLAVSGAAWFDQKRKDGRQQEGIDFFMLFANSKCGKVVIENPVGIMSKIYREPNQIIQPYMFGDSYSKSTCLWLKNLPLLRYGQEVQMAFGEIKPPQTNIVDKGEQVVFKSGCSMPKWYADAWHLPPEERAKVRSQTFPGIAEAMAEQWGTLREVGQ